MAREPGKEAIGFGCGSCRNKGVGFGVISEKRVVLPGTVGGLDKVSFVRHAKIK